MIGAEMKEKLSLGRRDDVTLQHVGKSSTRDSGWLGHRKA
jgi:hypothetical protein